MRVVVTRPRVDAERTAAVLRARGHEVLMAPLMHMEPIAADLDGEWSASHRHQHECGKRHQRIIPRATL